MYAKNISQVTETVAAIADLATTFFSLKINVYNLL